MRTFLRMSMIAGLLLAGLPGEAWADGWFYKWSCLGHCDPLPEGSDVSGPYATEEECEYVRNADTRPQQLAHLDNTYTQRCEYVGSGGGGYAGGGGGGGARSPMRIAKTEWGFDVGPGWTTTEAGVSTDGTYTLGIDGEVSSGRDAFGGLMTLGFHLSQVSSPALGAGEHTYGVVPLLLGLRLSPRIAHGEKWALGLDLAASYGGFMQVSCSGCAGGAMDDFLGFGYVLKAGIDYFLSDDIGVGLDALFTGMSMTDSTSGVKVESPPWMIRLSFVQRPRD